MANSPYLYGGGLPKAAKPKPKPVQKPAAKVVVSQPVRKQSPAGTSAAQQIVNAALAPLLANIKSQGVTLAGNQAAQQAALQGYTKNIIDYLKGAPAAIQSDYQGAVDTTQNLAQASADQLLKANPNSLNQADLAAINAPQAQRDALSAQNQNVYGGGSAVLFKTAGAIPATAFAEDKANQKAFADSLPSIQGLQGQQLFAKLLASQNEDTQKLEAQKAEVLAKGPGLLQQAQNSLAPTSSKAPTTRRIGDGYYEWTGKGWRLLAKASASDHSGQVRLPNGQYQTTLNGTPIGKPWGPVKAAGSSGGSKGPGKLYGNSTSGYFTYQNGVLAPVAGYSPTGKKGSKPPSASQVSTTFARANKAGKDTMLTVATNVWHKFPGWNAKTDTPEYQKAAADFQAWKNSGKSFGTAMYKVTYAIAPHLKSIGYTQAQVKAAAYQIVSSSFAPPKGYKPPRAGVNPNNASYSPGAGGNPEQVAYKMPTVSFDSLSRRAVGTVGVDLGGPAAHYGKHDSGENWQSNNAWDIGVPVGTPIYATSDGTIGSQIGVQSSRPADGERLTLDGSDNSYWYGHLSRILVKPGQRVKAGQLLGYSGKSENGAAHLHIGVKYLPGTSNA